jgi:toxin-antitoxin system PIN domain toxin
VNLPDSNLLLYAVDQSSPLHDGALLWLERAISTGETVAFAWSSLITFVRISTRIQVFKTPLSFVEAMALVDDWLGQPNSIVVHPTPKHARVLRELLTPLGTAGNLVPDAYLAALAIEHDATLYSTDNDFSRFIGLRWINPLK